MLQSRMEKSMQWKEVLPQYRAVHTIEQWIATYPKDVATFLMFVQESSATEGKIQAYMVDGVEKRGDTWVDLT